VALNLAMNVAFMVPLQHVGPGLATSLAAIFNVGWLGAILARRGQLHLDAALRRRGAGMVAASAAMGLALWLTQRVLFATPLHGLVRIAALGMLVAVGLVVYAAAAALFGAADWRELGRMVRRGRRGKIPEPTPVGDTAPRR
jgi:putative peptidoglycan lipid II flippase